MTSVVKKAAGRAAEKVETLKRSRSSESREGDRVAGDGGPPWVTVTINRPVEEVTPGDRLPRRLAELGDQVEAKVRPAPGGRGTELAVRPAPGEPGGVELREALRTALRQDKQELEVGEILVLEPVPHGPRSETPTGKLIEAAAERAGAEGVR